MSLTESLLSQSIKPAQYQGPLDWRKLVQWLQEDAVITAQEAERTIARCSAAESAQLPLVRLANQKGGWEGVGIALGELIAEQRVIQ